MYFDSVCNIYFHIRMLNDLVVFHARFEMLLINFKFKNALYTYFDMSNFLRNF